jgi:ATP-dependent helicase HepA
VIRSQGERIKLLLARAQQLAERAGTAIAAEARRRMDRELADELQRLRALAKVNPNVREDEIEQLAIRRELIALQFEDARVRLDAVRVVVVR